MRQHENANPTTSSARIVSNTFVDSVHVLAAARIKPSNAVIGSRTISSPSIARTKSPSSARNNSHRLARASTSTTRERVSQAFMRISGSMVATAHPTLRAESATSWSRSGRSRRCQSHEKSSPRRSTLIRRYHSTRERAPESTSPSGPSANESLIAMTVSFRPRRASVSLTARCGVAAREMKKYFCGQATSSARPSRPALRRGAGRGRACRRALRRRRPSSSSRTCRCPSRGRGRRRCARATRP